ncbi:MAG: DNA-deoxyinosine glycosylase [Actinobacteria bacterium]|nr:DNA-deoxyinosine glycosylase [Actinomycetota bacterium]
MGIYEHVDHGFEPVFDHHSKLLILGSFPSVASRENRFYYGNPQNRFWRVISALTGRPVPINAPIETSIAEKKRLLLDHGIALWDVVDSCDIIGSSDQSIRNVRAADIQRILDTCDIHGIYANGHTAEKLYHRYLKEDTGHGIITLPSTSPANAGYSLDRLITAWGDKLELSR